MEILVGSVLNFMLFVTLPLGLTFITIRNGMK